jgi:hypothetical protein
LISIKKSDKISRARESASRALNSQRSEASPASISVQEILPTPQKTPGSMRIFSSLRYKARYSIDLRQMTREFLPPAIAPKDNRFAA